MAAVVDEASSTFELESNGNVTDVMASVDCTVKLPANPRIAETVRISANGGTVTVNGNGHTIAGGVSSVTDNSFRDFAFSKAGSEWVPAATGSSGSGPAAPDRSFQFDDAGSFGGSTFFFLASPDQIHATEDQSAITQHDATTDTDLYVYQHLYTPDDDPTFPPGTSLVFGSDNVGNLASLWNVVYNATKFWNWTYCDNADGTNASHIVFGLGAQPNGLSTPLTISGNYFFPNTILSGTFIDPSDDLLGGGQGVEFIGRAEVEPTSPPSSESGIVRYVGLRSTDSVPFPFARSSADDQLNLAAVAPMIFGLVDLGESADAYMPPGFAATGVTTADNAPFVTVPADGYLVGMAVRQNTAGADGTVTYTVMTRTGSGAASATPITVTLAGDGLNGTDADWAHLTRVSAGDSVAVLSSKAGVSSNPFNVTALVYFIPLRLG